MGHVSRNELHQGQRKGQFLRGLLADAGIVADLLPLSRLPPALAGDFGPDLLLLVAPAEPEDSLLALRHLRGTTRLPCLVLAPRLPGEMVAALLESGADDVLDHGENPRVALARARAVLRRGHWGHAMPSATPQAMPPAWHLLPSRRMLLRPCGNDAELTTAEYDLFRLLSEEPGQVVSRDAVAQHVLRRRITATDRSVDNLVMRLRRKLGQDSAVKTVRSQGYMFAGFDSGSLRVG